MITDSKEFQKRIEEIANDIADNHNNLAVDDDYIDNDDVIEHNHAYLLNSTHDMKEEIEELFQLLEFKDNVGSREWDYGLTFIDDDSFVDYIKQHVEENYDMTNTSFIVIDWEETAKNLQHDYSCAELDGTTYYYID